MSPFLTDTQGDIGPSPPSIVGGAKRVELKGNMVVIAYVHWKSSCGEAIKVRLHEGRGEVFRSSVVFATRH